MKDAIFSFAAAFFMSVRFELISKPPVPISLIKLELPSRKICKSCPAPKVKRSSAAPPVLSPNAIIHPLVSKPPPSCGDLSLERSVTPLAS